MSLGVSLKKYQSGPLGGQEFLHLFEAEAVYAVGRFQPSLSGDVDSEICVVNCFCIIRVGVYLYLYSCFFWHILSGWRLGSAIFGKDDLPELNVPGTEGTGVG